MRKMTKVLVATALLALGASFTSMAAAKTGTWMLEEDGWYCYDADGDAWEDEFCLSYGKEYYMGDDGLMTTSAWVEYDGAYYYVGSDGAKTVSDWRFVAPADDEEADAEWFYFDTKGRRVSGKKVVDGKTYYFDNEGVMLTGWVDAEDKEAATSSTEVADLVYCDENGARVASQWIKTFVPGTAEDEQEDADTFWYYIKSKGTVQTAKANDINGQTYFFNADAQMLHGWVQFDGTNYVSLNDTEANMGAGDVFFCGNSDQGWVKKNTWVKTWEPLYFDDEDADIDQYWYYLGKNGVMVKADTTTSANAVTFVNGDATGADRFSTSATDSNAIFKEIDKKTYAFKSNGQMWKGLVDVEGDVYYFGGADDGAMKTGDVMIADNDDYEFKFFFGESSKDDYKKGVAVTGAADGELYDCGQLVTTDEDFKIVPMTVVIDGVDTDVEFVIDNDGDIRTSKKKYKNDLDVEILDATVEGFTFNPNKGPAKGSF